MDTSLMNSIVISNSLLWATFLNMMNSLCRLSVNHGEQSYIICTLTHCLTFIYSFEALCTDGKICGKPQGQDRSTADNRWGQHESWQPEKNKTFWKNISLNRAKTIVLLTSAWVQEVWVLMGLQQPLKGGYSQNHQWIKEKCDADSQKWDSKKYWVWECKKKCPPDTSLPLIKNPWFSK